MNGCLRALSAAFTAVNSYLGRGGQVGCRLAHNVCGSRAVWCEDRAYAPLEKKTEHNFALQQRQKLPQAAARALHEGEEGVGRILRLMESLWPEGLGLGPKLRIVVYTLYINARRR